MRPAFQYTMSDQIYTVEDYWDGPREGFATFDGRPHHYKSIFDESEDEWSETWLLAASGG